MPTPGVDPLPARRDGRERFRAAALLAVTVGSVGTAGVQPLLLLLPAGRPR